MLLKLCILHSNYDCLALLDFTTCIILLTNQYIETAIKIPPRQIANMINTLNIVINDSEAVSNSPSIISCGVRPGDALFGGSMIEGTCGG
tara:strand:+ start:971 stop:1240 length:270 start_codon:yes stop_codon:yes gene_type:complete